jgi:hypothetical protein
MCVPVLAVMAIASMAATVVSAQAQSKQANQQADAMAKEQQQNQNALGLRMNQEATAAANEANERNKHAQQEAAAFSAVSGEYGGGVSSDRGLAAINAARTSDLGSIAANRDNALSQMGQESQGSSLRYQSSLSSLARPSKLGVGLSLVGSAASAYASGMKPNPSTTPKKP